MKTKPPGLAQWLLQLFLKEDLLEEVEGDLEEKFYDTMEEKSSFKAKLNYWYQVINYLRPFALKNASYFTSPNTMMYRSYFKVGYRNILRNKTYSFINISGLAVGMAVTMLIGIWVYDELSYDEYHENKDRIAQVMEHVTNDDQISTARGLPIPLKSQLELEYGDDFESIILAFWEQSLIISSEDDKLTSDGNFMGPEVIDMFSIEMLKGGQESLQDPASIIISESLAENLFGDYDPMGKSLKIDNEMSVMVTGVYKDFPRNSTFYGLSWIAPWKLWESTQEWVRYSAETNDWGNGSFQIYGLVSDLTDMAELSDKVKRVKYNNVDEAQKSQNPELFLHPMGDWHLKSSWTNGVQEGGMMQMVVLFGTIGLLVLILACINFMNLSTAQSEKRTKEVGIRKAIGSIRGQLITQFLTESFLVVMLSFVLAVAAVWIAMPSFNQLVDKELFIPFGNLYFWGISLGCILITALIAGSYPALYLSSFKPIVVLKGTFKAASSALQFRRVLVVFQFAASIVLIIGTTLVVRQINHAKDRPMGYDVDGTIMLWSNSAGFKGKFDILRNELKSKDAIVEMSESTSPLVALFSRGIKLSWEGKSPDRNPSFGWIGVTPEYGQTVGWQITEGRDFSRDLKTDTESIIINKKAAEEMGMDNPIGKLVKMEGGNQDRSYEIVGVIENLLVESPFDEVNPMAFNMSTSDMNCMTIKLNPEKSVSSSLAAIEEVMNKHVPSSPFDYMFTDQMHAQKFAAEEKIGKLAGIFSVLAIIISCLGIFGMASFVAEQRTKEIGVRKVLGASVLGLWGMLVKGFVALVGISFLIAAPIAFYLLSDWLGGFQYRTEIHWSVFAFAGLGTLFITMVTISYHVISATMRNPLHSLKSE